MAFDSSLAPSTEVWLGFITLQDGVFGFGTGLHLIFNSGTAYVFNSYLWAVTDSGAPFTYL